LGSEHEVIEHKVVTEKGQEVVMKILAGSNGRNHCSSASVAWIFGTGASRQGMAKWTVLAGWVNCQFDRALKR
jgi:hypothetical protein